MGSSWLLNSPIVSSSSSSSYSQSLFFYSCKRNVEASRRSRTAAASLNHESPKEFDFNKRRAILFVGLSVLPFYPLRARALEDLMTEERDVIMPMEKEKPEQALGRNGSSSPLSLLNGFGIFSSGVLGALYALAQKENKATEATIKSIETKLKEKEAAVVTLEKNFQSKLLSEQEEKTKQLKKAKEEQQSLLNQLSSANSTISGLGNELRNEKRLTEELNTQIDIFHTELTKTGEDKKKLEVELKEKLNIIEGLQERINLVSLDIKGKEDNIRNITSSIAARELELKNLTSIYHQSKDELELAKSEIKGLKGKLTKSEEDLEAKCSLVDELNARVTSLIGERDDSSKKLKNIQEQFNDLKLSSEKKRALDAKLLSEKENEIEQLKEKLNLAVNEAIGNKVLIADLTKERDDLRKLLDKELSDVKKLNKELQITKENFDKSMREVSDLSKQLSESRKSCSDLETEISKARSEFIETKELLEKNFNDAKLGSEVLASELASAKETLKKTIAELENVSKDLFAMRENCSSLESELVDVYKKAESAVRNLKDEKQLVASLNKELEALEKQLSKKDQELRKSVERDLEEATKSLEEMNQNAAIISRELEEANSQISALENEKELISRSLAEQKNVTKEARENLEDAHNLVMRLGKERESLEKRGKKLEEELASAKGEMLRLRSELNSTRVVVNDLHQQKGDVEENAAAVPSKKNSRRRKSSS